MYDGLQNLLLGSLRKQLMVGMTLVIVLVMTSFIWETNSRQLDTEIKSHTEQVTALAESVATSSAIWVASRDYSGLQEIVEGVAGYPNLRYVIVLDSRGQVLAHSDPTKVGLYLIDLPKNQDQTVLHRTLNQIDVVSPIKITVKPIGWVRISIDRTHFNAEVGRIRQDGFKYTLLGIVFSILIATISSRYLTRRLSSIQRVADAVQNGRADVRVVLSGDDEAALLARRFNDMLDSLQQRESQLKSFYEFDIVGLTITSPQKGWIRVNKTLCNMLEYSEQELKQLTWTELTHPEDLAADVDQFNKLMANEIDGYQLEKRFVSKTGKVIPTLLVVRCVRNSKGEVEYITAMVQDISERKAAEKSIETLAFFDPLTNLPNRRLIVDRINSALLSSVRNHLFGALLFIDLDKFKTINDSLGHSYGDLLLTQAAQRILSCVRETDTVARLGGDEFLVLIKEVDDTAQGTSQKVAQVAEKIRVALAAPYLLNSHECVSTPSIGISLYRDNDESVESLLKYADMAMYQVKESGRNAVRFFDPAMQQSVETRAALESDLRQAVLHQELELHYQIQVDSKRRPIGVEALLRWNHPERGMVSPTQFIPIAEQTSLIIEIGDWVLDVACRQLVEWMNNEQARHLTLAVNVSAHQFTQSDFVLKVEDRLRKYGVHAERLKLELTESVVLTNVSEVINKMHALKTLGVKLSLDDFGTGYSSLSYLKQLPLDQLKIDQSFVRDMTTDPNDAVMVQTIVDLAKNFRMNVIAEGVETEEQLSLLVQQGCLTYQGYLFGRPVPIGQFEESLKQA